MGQKVNPIGMRLGINRDWNSRWFGTRKQFAGWLHEDLKIRKYIMGKVPNGDISKIQIERPSEQRIKVTISSSKVGIVIGKSGKEVTEMKKKLQELINREVFINIREVKEPLKEATLVAESIAAQLERRVSFRRAMKKMLERASEIGIPGMKIMVSGRLGGAEIARREWYLHGRVPLHTLKADVDFALAKAVTKYGVIGVKVWVYRGDIESSDQADSNLGEEMIAAE
ncbi:MAG: 30S ribosomal protein S3 [Candidatus Wallbacteria bacterium]|nr:30S ribosomal protein S3 [Candidatus Wallbacteria bacterium]